VESGSGNNDSTTQADKHDSTAVDDIFDPDLDACNGSR
jgi:hypothetical protein